jgi:CRISPR/Cas system CSM-associated protein Csm2 small subunit
MSTFITANDKTFGSGLSDEEDGISTPVWAEMTEKIRRIFNAEAQRRRGRKFTRITEIASDFRKMKPQMDTDLHR